MQQLFSCRFQFTAPHPAGSAVLGVRLLVSPSVVSCSFFSFFLASGDYPTLAVRNGNSARVSGTVVELDGNIDGWLKAEGAGNRILPGA